VGFVELKALSTWRRKGYARTTGKSIWIERSEEIDRIGERADLEKVSGVGISCEI